MANRLRSIEDRIGGIMLLILFLTSTAAMGNENPVKLTIKENGTHVDLQKRQQLEIVLPASLGTGFSWRVRSLPETLISTGEPQIRKSESAEPKAGATEYQVFRFEAGKTGTGKLALDYARPWKNGTPPINTYTLTINVR